VVDWKWGILGTDWKVCIVLNVDMDADKLGIMFYAMLAFPSTPSHSQGNVNPFDFISPPRMTPSIATSPFALPTADTDLCLSLESMRGRKYLQVRGLTDLPAEEILEGDTDESGVQM